LANMGGKSFSLRHKKGVLDDPNYNMKISYGTLVSSIRLPTG